MDFTDDEHLTIATLLHSEKNLFQAFLTVHRERFRGHGRYIMHADEVLENVTLRLIQQHKDLIKQIEGVRQTVNRTLESPLDFI